MSKITAEESFSRRYAIDEKRFGIVRQSVDELPVIDVGVLINGGTETDIDAVAAEIRAACINSGFFYITNYGISDAEMRTVATKAIEFFRLPQEEKMQAHSDDFITERGYQPMSAEKITPGFEPDFKEYYDFGLELEDESLLPIDRGTTKWPGGAEPPEFREIMRTHTRRTAIVGQQIIRGFARALVLPDDFFDEPHDPPFFNFRPSYYPPANDVLKQNLWSCGPHTDYMSMTMLWQDEVGGLEVMNLNGQWIEAPPKPETMVLNIADMMSIWTNDLFTSNPHRVANRTTNHRLSMAHFIGPGATAQVECLPTCQSAENPPRYPSSITTTQHIINIMSKSLGPESIQNANIEKSEVTEQLRSHDRIGAS